MKHSCINKLYIQLYFCTYASCICLFVFLLLCISEATRWPRTYAPPVIIYCGLCVSSPRYCSNIFSHAAIGQCMRHLKKNKKKTRTAKWKGNVCLKKDLLLFCMQKKIYKDGINWCVVVPDELPGVAASVFGSLTVAVCCALFWNVTFFSVANHSRERRTWRIVYCVVNGTIAATCFCLFVCFRADEGWTINFKLQL